MPIQPRNLVQLTALCCALLVSVSQAEIVTLENLPKPKGIAQYMGATPQLMSMMLDYVPEAIALGGLVASGSAVAPLLALLIGLQNLPEGFNSYREIICTKECSPKKAFSFMGKQVFIGPIAGVIRYYFLSEYQAVLSAIMLFASGGILYLIFQGIAPQSRLNKHWMPPLGAVVGFCVALFSKMMVMNT